MNNSYARQILKKIYAEFSGLLEEEEAIFARWDDELLYQEVAFELGLEEWTALFFLQWD